MIYEFSILYMDHTKDEEVEIMEDLLVMVLLYDEGLVAEVAMQSKLRLCLGRRVSNLKKQRNVCRENARKMFFEF